MRPKLKTHKSKWTKTWKIIEIVGKWNNFNWILYKFVLVQNWTMMEFKCNKNLLNESFHTTYNDVRKITFWIIERGINYIDG
jgi:hypothetical protein